MRRLIGTGLGMCRTADVPRVFGVPRSAQISPAGRSDLVFGFAIGQIGSAKIYSSLRRELG
jgi:hypothetical protein